MRLDGQVREVLEYKTSCSRRIVGTWRGLPEAARSAVGSVEIAASRAVARRPPPPAWARGDDGRAGMVAEAWSSNKISDGTFSTGRANGYRLAGTKWMAV